MKTDSHQQYEQAEAERLASVQMKTADIEQRRDLFLKFDLGDLGHIRLTELRRKVGQLGLPNVELMNKGEIAAQVRQAQDFLKTGITVPYEGKVFVTA